MAADIATLLAEAPWLARLARSLTGDPAEADDLVQETYAAALRSPPDTDRPLRPWLRRVATNLVRMRHRTRTRREANEIVVEPEPARTPEQLLERAQLERRLAELVLELDEPFRMTVLLRYREGLSAEQIAAQQHVPPGTVRRRLKTALDRLRDQLDEREHTNMRALFAAPIGTIAMAKGSTKLVLAVIVLLLLAGGFALWRRTSSTAPVPPDVPTAVDPRIRSLERPALFAQSGIAARAVRGRVTLDNAPYPRATVRLLHAQTEVVLAETTSDANGAFDLGLRAADVYVVTASAPDHAALPVHVDLRAGSSPIELVLIGCSHVRGTIVDGAGGPIGHARIAREGAPVPFAESDASGRYDLCTHFGSTTLRYSASGYQSLLVVVDVGPSTTRDIVLVPEATVEGTVVTMTGEPVPEAWVVIDPSDKGTIRNAPATAFSDAAGRFRITGISPGRNFVSALAPGLRSTHEQEIIVGSGQHLDDIVVRLAPAATISGIVVVAGGTPVAGAGIGMRVGKRDETGILAVTQPDGTFVIDRAPRGSVALYVANHTVVTPRSLELGDRPTTVRIEVDPLGRVRGRVLRDGAPVPSAQVTCPRTRVFTDATGAYTCDGVDAGTHQLFADTPAGVWGRGTVTVTRGETVQLDLVLELSAMICGTVVDERAAPLAGIEVRVAERTTGDFGKDTSGTDGAFCARLLTGGTYDVAVFSGARELELPAPLGVTLGATERRDLAIAVTAPRLSITGTVSDPRGVPVPDATVRVFAANKSGAPIFDKAMSSSLVITDEAGRFTATKLAAGDYTLVAFARDGSEVIKSPVAAGARDVAITLEPAGRIDGRLVGFTTAPTITGLAISGAHVAIDLEVDGDRFRAGGLSPGTYVLMAVTDAHEGDTREVIVRPGQTTTVTMTSRGTTTITGVARDYKTRAPVPGVRCDALARQGDILGAIYTGPDDGTVADARGAFRLTGSAGEVVIICQGSNATGERKATVPRDRVTNVEVLMVARTQDPGTIDARFDFLSHRLRELTTGGAADRAGLLVGDEVIEVDGVSVADIGSRQTMLLITQRLVGTTATLTILRGGTVRRHVVTVRAANN